MKKELFIVYFGKYGRCIDSEKGYYEYDESYFFGEREECKKKICEKIKGNDRMVIVYKCEGEKKLSRENIICVSYCKWSRKKGLERIWERVNFEKGLFDDI